jgi:acyl-coenzyme A thioesterase PaaI-like protein
MSTPAEDLNTALRDLIDVVRTADLEGIDLDAQIVAVRAVADGLRPLRHEGMRMQAALRFEHYMDDVAARIEEAEAAGVDDYARDGHKDPDEFFPYSPVVGRLNPVAPPVRMWRAEGRSGTEIHGEAVFGAAYNGPPDCVHGGVIAETIDELLGSVCVVNGLGGFTGTLTIVYRSTTPLGEPITMRGWHDRTEGRKTFAKGTLHHGDTLCAEAEGIFIQSAKLPGGGVPRAGV